MTTEKKLGTDPAFPNYKIWKNPNAGGQDKLLSEGGMSTRLYIAAMMMQSIVRRDLELKYIPFCVESSYKIADELLKQENQ